MLLVSGRDAAIHGTRHNTTSWWTCQTEQCTQRATDTEPTVHRHTYVHMLSTCVHRAMAWCTRAGRGWRAAETCSLVELGHACAAVAAVGVRVIVEEVITRGLTSACALLEALREGMPCALAAAATACRLPSPAAAADAKRHAALAHSSTVSHCDSEICLERRLQPARRS